MLKHLLVAVHQTFEDNTLPYAMRSKPMQFDLKSMIVEMSIELEHHLT
jgi:hypothetical protein